MRLLLALACAALAASPGGASPYDERRAAAVKTCEAIDPAAYQSGLYFNPDGYRSYYVRSECLQRAAVRFRDASLCARVKRRWSLLSSSWGYSPANCRRLVAAGRAKDRAMLEDIRAGYRAGRMVLRDFRVELDNNGRDFDFIPIVDGEAAHGYFLRFELIPDAGGSPVVLHADGYWVERAGLRIYVPRAEIGRRVAGFESERPYEVAATMTLSIPVFTGDAEFSDTFIADVFPERERSQTVMKRVPFPAAEPPRRPIAR